jgi:MscS family membrane protein
MYVLETALARQAVKIKSERDNSLLPQFDRILRILVIIAGGMAILHVATGLDVGPMPTSLGIGGITVALATEDSIANVTRSFTILFDKSFYWGAFISAGKQVLLALDTTPRNWSRRRSRSSRRPSKTMRACHPDQLSCVYLVGCKDRRFNIAATAWYHPFDYKAFREWVHTTCPGNLIHRITEAGITYAVAV